MQPSKAVCNVKLHSTIILLLMEATRKMIRQTGSRWSIPGIVLQLRAFAKALKAQVPEKLFWVFFFVDQKNLIIRSNCNNSKEFFQKFRNCSVRPHGKIYQDTSGSSIDSRHNFYFIKPALHLD